VNGIRQSGKLCQLEKRKWQHTELGGPPHGESGVGHYRQTDNDHPALTTGRGDLPQLSSPMKKYSAE
jgi:hypothetical protein